MVIPMYIGRTRISNIAFCENFLNARFNLIDYQKKHPFFRNSKI